MKKSYDRITVTFEKLNTARIKNIGKMSKSDFSRDRKMPLSDIIRCILNKRGKTITMEINNYFKEIDKKEQRVTKQAFCKQRCKLNPEVFKVLNKEYVESIYEEDYKTFKGYMLMAIDGSILEIPNSEELREQYGYQNSKSKLKQAQGRKALPFAKVPGTARLLSKAINSPYRYKYLCL